MDRPLNHSVENIFTQVGQFDRYAIFDFYYGSDAYKQYGHTVYGYIIYSPTERAILKQNIQSDNIGDNDGLILLDGALQDKELNNTLATKGFWARDVQHLKAMDTKAITNEFENTDIKEIPNTITVPFNNSGFNIEGMQLLNFNNRIKYGIPFIPYEYQKYISLLFFKDPESVSKEDIAKYLIDSTTGFYYDDVTITLFGNLYRYDQSDKRINIMLNTALKNRRIARTNFICKHLGIAPKHIERLRISDHSTYLELMQVVLGFESATITLWGWKNHIYWDFERFIHIYLRHYKNFFISESSKGQGTNFQYRYKDIRRLIEIVLKNNQEAIEAKLGIGKPYQVQGDKGYYYNGNYYTFKIEKDGRLMQFHPQDRAII